MALTTTQRRLALIASGLGVIQGLAWFIMSLLCIIQYLNDTPPDASSSSYIGNFNYELYLRFLDKYIEYPTNMIITAKAFTVFMWIYLILDLIWAALSLYLIDCVNKYTANLRSTLRYWGILTSLISFLDLLLVIFIGVDYDTYCINQNLSIETLCTNATLPVLVIVARGFVLWIINIVFVYVVHRITKILDERTAYEKRFQTIPRATFQPPPNLQTQTSQFSNASNNRNSYQRTPYDGRNPPNSPLYPNQQQSFGRY